MDSNTTNSEYFRTKLEDLAKLGLRRRMVTLRDLGSHAIINGKRVINFCSNDYLGLSRLGSVVRSAKAIGQVSPCSSRLLAGNHPSFEQLEVLLAEHRSTEVALVYPTGYAACVGVLTALADSNSTIFSDELNHASIIDGCRLSGATVQVFPHNDYEALARLMKENKRRNIIVTEGVFSMDGDIADLKGMVEVAQKHDSLTIVDDAHGDFLRGPGFSGTPGESGVNVDVHVSSLSKALGCFGGYAACSSEIRELLINSSRQFIYTSALPESLCKAGCTAVRFASNGTRQTRLARNIEALHARLLRKGIHVDKTSQIMPMIIGNENKATEFSKVLFDLGVFAQAVRYPTVARGKARVRISLTSLHTTAQMAKASDAVDKAMKIVGI